MKKSFILSCIVAVFIFTSCSSYKKVPYLQNSEEQAQNGNVSLFDARIMPKDLLSIVVSCPEEPELAIPYNLTVATANSNVRSTYQSPVLQQYLVDNNGNIYFPMLGSIHIGGLTKAEKAIREKLQPQFRYPPIISVRMINYKISVIGEVNRPSTFTTSNEKMNIFEALAMAGDLTIYGLRENVKLIREDDKGIQHVIELDLTQSDILNSPYYYLQQNDIIYVTPNKVKAKNSSIGASTNILFSVLGSTISVANLVITLSRLK